MLNLVDSDKNQKVKHRVVRNQRQNLKKQLLPFKFNQKKVPPNKRLHLKKYFLPLKLNLFQKVRMIKRGLKMNQ